MDTFIFKAKQRIVVGVYVFRKQTISMEDGVTLEESKFEESCLCEIESRDNEKMLLNGVYRSRSSNGTNDTNLNKLFHDAIKLRYNYTTTVGDFNYP